MPQVNRPPLDPNAPSIFGTVGGLASSAYSATASGLSSLKKSFDSSANSAASGADPSIGDVGTDAAGHATPVYTQGGIRPPTDPNAFVLPGVGTYTASSVPASTAAAAKVSAARTAAMAAASTGGSASAPVMPATPQVSAPASAPAPAKVPTAREVEDAGLSVQQLLDAAVVGNPLNGFFQIVHHFRLFMANDRDLEAQAGAAGNAKQGSTTTGSSTSTTTPTAAASSPAGGAAPAVAAPPQTVAPGAVAATAQPTPGALASANVNTGLDTSGLSPAEVRIKASIASFPDELTRQNSVFTTQTPITQQYLDDAANAKAQLAAAGYDASGRVNLYPPAAPTTATHNLRIDAVAPAVPAAAATAVPSAFTGLGALTARLGGGAPIASPAVYGPPAPPTSGSAPAAAAGAPATAANGSAISKAVSATATQPSSVASTASPNDVGGLESLNNNDMIKVLDSLPQVTLAESGITTYNIKDVVIESFIGPQGETRNVNSNKFTITIAEPMGVGFLDAFKDSAAQVNIDNPQKALYYLELTFRGYNEDGTINVNPLQGLVPENGARWVWQIKIVNVDVSLDAGGGTYKLDALPYAESAYDDDLLRSPDVFNIPGKTLGSAANTMMTNLTEARNARQGGKQVTWKPPVWHPIVGGPLDGKDASGFLFVKDKSEQNTSRSFTLNTETAEPMINVNKGTSIADFFDFMLINTKEAQDLAMDRDGRVGENNGTDTSTNTKKFRESYIFRIEPDIKVTGFDDYSQNYQRDITYHLFPYYTQAAVTDEQQPIDAQTPEVQEKMLRALLAQDFISKRYDYIFSGLNTEVTRFDVNFNFAWNVIIASSDGANTNYSNFAAAARTSPATTTGNAEENKTKVVLAQLAALNVDVDNSNKAKNAYADALGPLNAKISAAYAKPLTKAEAAELADDLATRKSLEEGQKLAIATNDEANSKFNALAKSIKQVNTPPEVGKPAYAEQIFADKINGTGNTLPHPISFEQLHESATAQAGTGTEGDFHKDKTVFGTVLGQLYAPLAKQFISVTMEIRGDPYWLGQTNLQRQSLLRNPDRNKAQMKAAQGPAPKTPGAATAKQITKLPDWTKGDSIFALEFKYPLGLGENLAPIFKQDEVFFGLYRATKVEHHFSSDGFFKQNITGYRMPLHSLSTALSAPSSGKTPTSTTLTGSGTAAMTTPAAGTMAAGAAGATSTPTAGALANANVNLGSMVSPIASGSTTTPAATTTLTPEQVRLRQDVVYEAAKASQAALAGQAPDLTQQDLDIAFSAQASLAAAGYSPTGRVNLTPADRSLQGGLTGLGGLVSGPSPLAAGLPPALPAYSPPVAPPAAPAGPLVLPQRY